jgi:hypothetical protein
MERYNNKSDFDHFRDMMSKKSTRMLKRELKKIESKASTLRTREFNGFKMSPRISRRLDIYAQERMTIETILYEREREGNP